MQKKTESSVGLSFFVAPIGFEPIQTEPESAVLPLHNRAIAKCAAKIHFFLYRAYIYEFFFQLTKMTSYQIYPFTTTAL